MRFDKKSPLKSDKKAPPKPHKKGVSSYNRKTALLEEAITHMNAGKYGRSSAALKELLALDPLNTEARRLFATLHLRLGSLISARTAFESLAREALERQDYWLAESLLREYLTAGPRCVPFLVMLGQLYEEKGDSMSAVAEYGKAIEVLVEDPDPDHPNRGAELYAKIRSLAPYSSVSSRLAALFDRTTGEVRVAPSPMPSSNDALTSRSGDVAAADNAQELDDSLSTMWGASDAPAASSPSISPEEAEETPTSDAATTQSNLLAAEPPDALREPAWNLPKAIELSRTSMKSSVREHEDQPFKLADETPGTGSQALPAGESRSHGAVQSATLFSFKREEEASPVSSFSAGAPLVTERDTAAPPMSVEQAMTTSTADSDQSASAVQVDPVDGSDGASSHQSSETEGERFLPSAASDVLPSLTWDEVIEAVRLHRSEQAPSSIQGNLLVDSSKEEPPIGHQHSASEPMNGTPDSAGLLTHDSMSESPRVSEPMPWEQVEVASVPILQHEREPETDPDSDQDAPSLAEECRSPHATEPDWAPNQQAAEQAVAMPDPVERPLVETSEALVSAVSTPEDHASDPLVASDEVVEPVQTSMEDTIPSMTSAPLGPGAGDQPTASVEVPQEIAECVSLAMANQAADTLSVVNQVPAVLTDEPLDPEADAGVHLVDHTERLEESVPQVEEVGSSAAPPVVALSQIHEKPTESSTVSHPSSAEPPAPLEEPAVASASAGEPLPAEPETRKPPSDGIRILWDASSSQSTSEQAGLGLLARWLRRPTSAEPTVASEAQDSTQGASNHPSSSVAVTSEGSAGAPSPIQLLLRSRGTSPTTQPSTTKRKSPETLAVRLYNRVTWDVLYICRRCFSTTRSLTISLLSLVLAVVLVATICVGTTGLAWIVMEQQPSPVYRALTTVPQRLLKDSSTNGYLMLLGFDAGPNQDPMQASLGRQPDKADLAMAQACLLRPDERSGASRAAEDRMLATWHRDEDPAARFRVQSARVKAWGEQADRWVARYKRWLTMPFEDWGYGEPISPNCQLILRAHRLYVADGFTKDVDAGVDRLENDLGRWRQVMSAARSLPIKMLAVDAIRDDVAIMSGLLAHPDLDDKVLARLMKLARPLDEAEQSLRWPMQSELVRATKIQDMLLNQDGTERRPLLASLASMMPLPKQRRLNDYADYYDASSRVRGDKLFATLPKRSAFIRYPAEGWMDYGTNPMENLVGLPPLPAWDIYSGRILSVDAQLRLSGLQAWIGRSRREQDILARIAKAGQALYDPFSGFPMLVNRRSGRIYSVGEDGKDNDGQAGRDISAAIPLSVEALQNAVRQASASKSRS